MPIDKILQIIIARFRRIHLQMRVSHGKKRGDRRLPRFAFRFLHQRIKQSDCFLRLLIEQLNPCMQ